MCIPIKRITNWYYDKFFWEEDIMIKNNARDTNYFTKFFTNCWCGEWLLVNEKWILMVGLNKNQ